MSAVRFVDVAGAIHAHAVDTIVTFALYMYTVISKPCWCVVVVCSVLWLL